MTPLLNWDDCDLINQVMNVKLSIKKHYQIDLRDDKINISLDKNAIAVVYIKRKMIRWNKNVKHREYHRDDKDPITGLTLPAVIYSDRCKSWWKNDHIHRIDKDENGLTLPAVINSDGTKYWYKDGQLHNSDIDKISGLYLPAIIDK